MLLRQPTIGDIQTVDLFYFDKQHEATCLAFCQKRNIDYLPIADDLHYVWELEDGTFERRKLSEAQRVEAETPLFRPELLKRFQHQPVQFVFDHGTMSGVVHFSDYNHPAVGTYLYAYLADYERTLRQLAVALGFRNSDMRAFFAERAADANDNSREHFSGRRDRYDQREPIMEELPEFQDFFLDDLVRFIKKHMKIRLSGTVMELRNQVMHARDGVTLEEMTTDDLIYSNTAFSQFFRRVQTLHRDHCRVHEKLWPLTADQRRAHNRLKLRQFDLTQSQIKPTTPAADQTS